MGDFNVYHIQHSMAVALTDELPLLVEDAAKLPLEADFGATICKVWNREEVTIEVRDI
jgi:hypothetical protein